jgi:predicted restriction endonuclease
MKNDEKKEGKVVKRVYNRRCPVCGVEVTMDDPNFLISPLPDDDRKE